MLNYKSIAIILPERLGDTIFHTPSIELISKAYPNVAIDIIALSKLSAMVVENNPHIRNIYLEPNKEDYLKISAECEAVFNVHNHAASRQAATLTGLPIITAEPMPGAEHQAEHALNFMQQLINATATENEKRYKLYPTQQNYQHIEALLTARGATKQANILIGCHLGCHSIAKRGLKFWKPLTHPKAWAFENFVELEKKLREIDPRFRLVITGSKSEKAFGKRFDKISKNVINLIDETTVLDLAALMDSLAAFVTPDTGVMHVCCATQTALIALFGPTNVEHTGPYPMQPQYRIISAESMEAIDVNQVLQAILTHPAVISRCK